MIPGNYRLLADGEIIRDGDLCGPGRLSDGTEGWGKAPQWLVGEAYLEGSPFANHPPFVARIRKE